MARPRRATVTAAIGFSPLNLRELEWIQLGKIAGLEFDDSARNEIRTAVNQYIESTLVLKDGAKRAKNTRKRSSPIEKWCALAAKTVAAWDELNKKVGTQAPRTAADLDELYYDNKHFTLLKFSPAVESLRLCLDERAPEIVDVNTNPFEEYISRLAGIVEAAGGKVTTSGDFSNRNKLSRFQEFVSELNRRLPEGVQEKHSVGALADKTHQAVVKWRRALS